MAAMETVTMATFTSNMQQLPRPSIFYGNSEIAINLMTNTTTEILNELSVLWL